MNVVEIVQDTITTFLYSENATLDTWQEQVIYLISFIFCIYLFIAAIKFIFNILKF